MRPWIAVNIAFSLMMGLCVVPVSAETNHEPILLAQTLFQREKLPEFEARIQDCTGHKLSVKARDCRSKFGKAKSQCRLELKEMRVKCRQKALNRWKHAEPEPVDLDEQLQDDEEEDDLYAVPPPPRNLESRPEVTVTRPQTTVR